MAVVIGVPTRLDHTARPPPGSLKIRNDTRNESVDIFLVEPAEALDIQVDQLAGMGPFMAAHRRGGLQIPQPAHPDPAQHAADGGRRHTSLRGNMRPGQPLTTQRDDARAGFVRCGPAQSGGPGRAILQAFRPLDLKPPPPRRRCPGRATTDPCGL